MEWRIRDVERAHRGSGRESEADVIWLVYELRRHREALIRVVSRCQDANDSDELAMEIKQLAYEVLGLYEAVPEDRR
jgi:hypothetical protein